MSKRKLLSVVACCLICCCAISISVFARRAESSSGEGSGWNFSIWRTDYGASNYSSGTSCASVSNAKGHKYTVQYDSANSGVDIAYTHQNESIAGVGGGYGLHFTINDNNNNGINVGQCELDNNNFGAKSDYWLVMESDDGPVYAHKINDDTNSVIVDFNNNEISYNVGDKGPQSVYEFGNQEEKENTGSETTHDNKLSDISFSMSNSSCEQMPFTSGASNYTISFKTFEGNAQGYVASDASNGAMTISDGKTSTECTFLGNSNGHTLSVHDGYTDSDASIKIPDSTNSLNVKLKVVNGKIQMEIDGVQKSDGRSGEASEFEEEEGEAKKEDETCMNSGAGDSLGWILCPILNTLSNAAGDIYTSSVEPALRIEPKLFNGGINGSDGTQQAWGIFQGIANTLFIILLLVVIFSQLTGVGIDNYGIKKILPKMIVAAILINLSYIICLVCIDLSNILGNGLKALFDNFGTNIQLASEVRVGINPEEVVDISSLNSGDGGAAATAITGIALLGILALGVWAVVQNPAILLSLLIAALGIVIAVFFLFVLLSAREAAIVVLTVISPLAFVCLMLPNTKKLFDKWLKFWEGLLLVYPICGLLIGAGNFVSKLLLTSGIAETGFVAAFMAMIIGIVPIFFIPTVLKGSFAAMGKIGSTFAGLGRAAGGAATKKIRSTEGYKAAQTRGYERKVRMKAGFNAKGQPTVFGSLKARFANTKVGRASGYQALQAARVAAANKNRERDIQANAELNNMDLMYQNTRRGNQNRKTEDMLKDRLRDATKTGNNSAIFSVIEQMKKSNMQSSHIANATREMLESSDFENNMNQGQRKNFLEEFAKKYGNDFLKKDFEQADYARKGGVGVNGATGLRGWAANNIAVDDLKDDDVSALSSDNLYDLVNAGKISQSQAQRVWANNGSMDDTNRLMLGAYGNNGTVMNKQYAQKVLNHQGNNVDTRGGDVSYTVNPTTGQRITQGVNTAEISAWTEKAATDTVIRDVRWKDAHGKHQQTDNLITEAGGATATALSNISANTGATAASTAQTAINTGETAANTAASASSLENINTNTGQSAASLGNIDASTAQTAVNTGETAANTAASASSLSNIDISANRTADGVDEVNAQLQKHTAAAMDAAVVNFDNNTLAEIATNPKADMNDPLRTAAEKEINRRVNDKKMDF